MFLFWVSVHINFLLLNFLHVYFDFKKFSATINVTHCLRVFALNIYSLDVIDWKSRGMSICKGVKVRLCNTRRWSSSFCGLLTWGIILFTLRKNSRHAVIILAKLVYHIKSLSFAETLRSRQAEEKSPLNSGFFMFSWESKKFTLLV